MISNLVRVRTAVGAQLFASDDPVTWQTAIAWADFESAARLSPMERRHLQGDLAALESVLRGALRSGDNLLAYNALASFAGFELA